MPPRRRGGGGKESTQGPAARLIARDEFSISARRITTPIAPATHSKEFESARQAIIENKNFTAPADAPDAATSTPDTELGPLLGAITDDVHRCSAAARDGVMADFAARVAHARRYLSGGSLAAALGAIAQARKAALAGVKQNAARELAGCKKAAFMARRWQRSTPSGRTLRTAPRPP